MKKIALIFLIFLFGAVVLLNPFKVRAFSAVRDLFYHAPCKTPVTYHIGTIDSRFGIAREELIQNLSEAEAGWESASGRNLFAYDPEAKLSVNLVYDRRQDLSNQIYDLKGQIEQDKDALKPEMEEYERRSQSFNERLENLNAEIERWNSEGGAPEAEYDKLVAEQRSLQQEANELNSMAKRLNRTSDQFAGKVNQLNRTVNRFNNALTVRPEEGLYDPNNNLINIYFHSDPSEFVHTLAHELGHARGLGHTDDPNAIMYTQTNKQVSPTTSDIQLLENACVVKSYAQVFAERIWYLYEYYTDRNKAINQGEAS